MGLTTEIARTETSHCESKYGRAQPQPKPQPQPESPAPTPNPNPTPDKRR
jgi:hypothetical protein